MKKLPDLEMPLNANERFLHAVAMRLDVLIHQNNSLVDGIARLLKEVPEQNTAEVVEPVEEVKKNTRKKK